MKDSEQTNPEKQNSVIVVSIPKRKTKLTTLTGPRSLRPMRSCFKNPSLKPKSLVKTQTVTE